MSCRFSLVSLAPPVATFGDYRKTVRAIRRDRWSRSRNLNRVRGHRIQAYQADKFSDRDPLKIHEDTGGDAMQVTSPVTLLGLLTSAFREPLPCTKKGTWV